MFVLPETPTPRRGFLARLAAGAAALGFGGLAVPLAAAGQRRAPARGADPGFEAWLDRITGRHKMVYDVPQPNGGFAFAWARVFLDTTNETYGTTDADNTVVIVLRHAGIPYAVDSAMWAKYKLGEWAKIADPATQAPAVRHPLVRLKPGDAPIPGMGADQLLAQGVLIGVCNVALTFLSRALAPKLGTQAETIKQDLVGHLLPGVQVVPSGVIALNRAQEKGCTYCFAG